MFNKVVLPSDMDLMEKLFFKVHQEKRETLMALITSWKKPLQEILPWLKLGRQIRQEIWYSGWLFYYVLFKMYSKLK